MGITTLECFGYAASLVVVLSFVMKDILKLRVLSVVGCSLFIIYGFMFENLRDGLPVIITNVAIICVNGYYLIKLLSEKKSEISK